jgi:hypothetical protein
MEKGKQIAKIEKSEDGTVALAPWGYSEDVKALAARMIYLAPNGAKLNDNERLALAQFSLTHGLDPSTGESYYIPGKGAGAGIRGFRRKAREQLRGDGWAGTYTCEYRQLDNDGKDRFGIPTRSMAFLCELRDQVTITAFVELTERMREKDAPWDYIIRVLGNPPVVNGYGYAMPSTPDKECPECHGTGSIQKTTMDGRKYQAGCGCWEDSKMPIVQRAMKRAEAHAIKQRFDLPFSTDGVATNSDPDSIGADEWKLAADELAGTKHTPEAVRRLAQLHTDNNQHAKATAGKDPQALRAAASSAFYGEGDGLLPEKPAQSKPPETDEQNEKTESELYEAKLDRLGKIKVRSKKGQDIAFKDMKEEWLTLVIETETYPSETREAARWMRDHKFPVPPSEPPAPQSEEPPAQPEDAKEGGDNVLDDSPQAKAVRAALEESYNALVDKARALKIDVGYIDPTWSNDVLMRNLESLTAQVETAQQ